MSVKIIDVPKEHIGEVYDVLSDTPQCMIVEQMIELADRLKDDDSAIEHLVDIFPVVISVIDNPSVNLKNRCIPYYLKFANNLTEGEIFGVVEDCDDFITTVTGKNRETIDNMINAEIAFAWLSNGHVTVKDLDRYKDRDWYENTIKLYKLGGL